VIESVQLAVVVKAVHDAYVKAIADKDLRDKPATGINAFSSTPEEFGRFLQAETTRWARVVRERNIKPG
jgi:tripartite-type tricarboxylate transporter receptor subunit TctC